MKQIVASTRDVKSFQLIDRSRLNQGNVLFSLIFSPIPPLKFQQFRYYLISKTFPDWFCWYSTNNRVGWHIFSNYCSGSNDCSVTNRNARHNNGFITNPYIVPYDDIALFIPRIRYICFIELPLFKE